MIESLLKGCVFTKTSSAKVAGVDDIVDGAIIDMSSPTEGEFDSVCFVAVLGTVLTTAVDTLKAFCGNVANLSDGAYKSAVASVTASGTNTNENLLILDVVKPGKRYVRCDLVLDTANSVVDSIIAIRYNAKALPTVQTSAVADSNISVN